jgi:hypothetical protein
MSSQDANPYGTIMASQFLKALQELINKYGDKPILTTFDSWCHQPCDEPTYVKSSEKCNEPHFLI